MPWVQVTPKSVPNRPPMLYSSYSGMMEPICWGKSGGLSFSPISPRPAFLATDKLSCIRAQIAAVQSEHLRHDSERYQSWLEGAKVKGMRPLYRAIRSPQEVLVRPFRDKEAALRAYLRYYQWAEIWSSQPTPVAPIAVIRQRAVAEASTYRVSLRRPFAPDSRAYLKKPQEPAGGTTACSNSFPLQLSPRSPTSSGGLRLRARHRDNGG